jgi:CubicO group peptidase (beta-lactamase class C family)
MCPTAVCFFGPALLATALAACTVAPPSPPPDPRIDAFRAALERDRALLRIPALGVAVVEDGAVLWNAGLGQADLERSVPATANTLFHIASVTKTFAALRALQLAEQGKLDLDAPATRWVPELTDGRIRVKHLLSHTSQDVPGTWFSYNPDRFEHLKTILEQVDGRPLRVQIVETFLRPLGMDDSVPGADVADDDTTWAVFGADTLVRFRADLARQASPYTLVGDRELVRTTFPPADFWASAGLLSTAGDLAKYAIAIDDDRIVSRQTLERAWTPFLSNAGKPLPQGLGWYVTDYRGERLVWHFGHWGTGFSAMFLMVPARRLTAVVLANSEALADHHYKIGEDATHNVFACDFLEAFVPALAGERGPPVVTGKLPDRDFNVPSDDCRRTSRLALEQWRAERKAKARPVVPLDPTLAAAVAGRYQFPGGVATFAVEDGRLQLDYLRGLRVEVFAQSPADLFVKPRAWKMTPVREHGKVVRLVITEGDYLYRAERIE